MQPKTPTPPPPTISVTDIYYVLFRHKWMILVFTLVGIGAAIALRLTMSPPYMSEAKLQIRYVEDNKSITPSGPGAQVQQVDPRGEGILVAEAETLMSLDVAAAVADSIGIERIVGKGVTTNREVAALTLRGGLNVEVPRRGNVLRVTYQHEDFSIVQPVLRKLIETYYQKHVEIHRNLGALDNFLTQETDRLRQSLTETEEELRKLRGRAGIVSLEETRKTFTERYSTLRKELDSAEADLSERVAALKEMQKHVLVEGAAASSAPDTNSVVAPKVKLPPDVIAEYKRVLERLDAAYKRYHGLLAEFTEASTPVRDQKALVTGLEAQKKEMETANPQLTEEDTAVASSRNVLPREQRVNDLTAEYARVAALQARVQTLTAQFNKIKADAGQVEEIESAFLTLQRKKERQEALYKSYSQSLDQMRVDSQLGAGRATGISEVQAPSLPVRDMKALNKKVAGASVGGLGLGIGLAFLLEMFLAQGVRKPSEVEKNFHLPLFLTIPELKGARKQGPGKLLNGGAKAALPAPGAHGEGAEVDGAANGHSVEKPEALRGTSVEIAPWEERHDLHPYCEALRDRLMSFFDLKGLTHKPKLVAVTSCSRGAGVTTLAAGLAASLSETGEGNVLLVDLNMERGAAHPFFKGKPAFGISDVLDQGKREEAQVQENLYMVQGIGTDDRLPKILPKRLAHLLPKLQASDYDYIIFDMPPVTQTSVTPRLTGFMDMVFLVVEDQKTNRDWLKQASGLLQQSKANLGAVYNKRRRYAPRWLHQEF